QLPDRRQPHVPSDSHHTSRTPPTEVRLQESTSMSAQPEIWRVSTYEGVFETDFQTLQQWIVEGCVLPTDKVSKGKLNWIEAGRVPKLKSAFNGEIDMPPPAEPVEPSSSTNAWQTPPPFGSTEPSDPVEPEPDTPNGQSFREGPPPN